MKTGLIGTNWGRFHIQTMKSLGYQVDRILGRDPEKTERIAREEDSLAVRNVQDLMEMDFIIIASPAETHGDYIAALQGKWILCEKPLGLFAWGDRYSGLHEQEGVFVNLAFSHLETFQCCRRLIQQNSIGSVSDVTLKLGLDFPRKRSPQEWFLDVTLHPYSWLRLVWPDMSYISHFYDQARDILYLEMRCGETAIHIEQYRLSSEGIKIELLLSGRTGDLHTAGGYFPGRQWNFDPISLNGHNMNAGEYSGPCDIWARANKRYMKNILNIIQKDEPGDVTCSDGIYCLQQAWDMEQSLSPLFK